MAEKYFMEGTLALEENQRQIIVIEAAGQPRDIKLRVAAYARVSSEDRKSTRLNSSHIH